MTEIEKRDWKNSLCLSCTKQDVCGFLADEGFKYKCDNYFNRNKLKIDKRFKKR